MNQEFDWIEDFAFNDYSQFGEDGVLQLIFSVIRPSNEWCFECGAADGLFFSNTRRLIEHGWHGVLVEADPRAFARLRVNNQGFGDRVQLFNCRVDSGHRIDGMLQHCGAPLDIDLVSIDVDGQDYYLLNSLLQYRPRVIVVEFDHNADDDFVPPLDGSGQAGRRATEKMAAGKFYTTVYRSFSNMILVRQPFDRLLHESTVKMAKGH